MTSLIRPILPRRSAPLLFAAIQSGMTTLIATGVATDLSAEAFAYSWLKAWLIAWILILPIVIVAAPFIDKAVRGLTSP